jgi:hypothetical protein
VGGCWGRTGAETGAETEVDEAATGAERAEGVAG